MWCFALLLCFFATPFTSVTSSTVRLLGEGTQMRELQSIKDIIEEVIDWNKRVDLPDVTLLQIRGTWMNDDALPSMEIDPPSFVCPSTACAESQTPRIGTWLISNHTIRRNTIRLGADTKEEAEEMYPDCVAQGVYPLSFDRDSSYTIRNFADQKFILTDDSVDPKAVEQACWDFRVFREGNKVQARLITSMDYSGYTLDAFYADIATGIDTFCSDMEEQCAVDFSDENNITFIAVTQMVVTCVSGPCLDLKDTEP